MVTTQSTHELSGGELGAIRALLDAAFDDFAEADWRHALGGVHAIVRERGEIVAHGAVVERRLTHAGRALRTGYVEGVAVRADSRRRGHGAAVMRALERIIRERHEPGALSTTESGEPFYRALGWRRWRGPTYAGGARTPDDDGGVYVLPVGVSIDLDGPLGCDLRDGDPW